MDALQEPPAQVFPDTHMNPNRKQDWASSQGSATWDTSPSRCSHTCPQFSSDDRNTVHTGTLTTHDLLPPDAALQTLQSHPELQALLSLLPSKQDMATLANDLKATWRQDLHVVKSDVAALQERVQKLEASQVSTQKLLSTLQASSVVQISRQQALAAQLDNLANRNRKNNIRLQGIPETIRTQDITPTLTKIFNSLLGKAADAPLEIDTSPEPGHDPA